MKFISLILFIVALIYTWNLTHHRMPIEESVHVGIQDDLKNIIQNYIQDNVQNASGIQFERMWSETVDASTVRAHFIYSFIDEANNRLEIDGYAVLNKVSENEEEVKFSFDELFIENQSIVFDEPMRITAQGKEEDSEKEDSTKEAQ